MVPSEPDHPDASYYDPDATAPCSDCGKTTKHWVLAERDGRCITCSREVA